MALLKRDQEVAKHRALLTFLVFMVISYTAFAFEFSADAVAYHYARKVLYSFGITMLFVMYVYYVRYKGQMFNWGIAITAIAIYTGWSLFEIAPAWARHQANTIGALIAMALVYLLWYSQVLWTDYKTKIALIFGSVIPIAELVRYILFFGLFYPNHNVLQCPYWEAIWMTTIFTILGLICAWFFIKRPLDAFDPSKQYLIYYRPRTAWGWLGMLWHIGGHTLIYDGTRDGGTIIRFSHSARVFDWETGRQTGKYGAVVIEKNYADKIANTAANILACKEISGVQNYENFEGRAYSGLRYNCFDLAKDICEER